MQIRVHAQPGVVGGSHRTRVGGKAGHTRLRRDLSGALERQLPPERGRGDIACIVELPQADDHGFPGHNRRQRELARLRLIGRDRQGGGERSGGGGVEQDGYVRRGGDIDGFRSIAE